MKPILLPFFLVFLLAPAVGAFATPEHAVSVSAAHYRTTPRDELLRFVEQAPAALNPPAREVRPPAAAQHYIFVAAETFACDVDFARMTALLAPALAQKGYVNAADAQGRIAEREKISLVLRVSHGTRPWRLPVVRTENLAWSDGLNAAPRGHLAGAQIAWDRRAGGDARFEFRRAPEAAAAGFELTRDFHLVVVDAFDYRELLQQGKAARRVWSTFIAVPQAPRSRFSDVAATLVRAGTPYFGETAPGLQVFSDPRTDIRIGQPVERSVSQHRAAKPKTAAR